MIFDSPIDKVEVYVKLSRENWIRVLRYSSRNQDFFYATGLIFWGKIGINEAISYVSEFRRYNFQYVARDFIPCSIFLLLFFCRLLRLTSVQLFISCHLMPLLCAFRITHISLAVYLRQIRKRHFGALSLVSAFVVHFIPIFFVLFNLMKYLLQSRTTKD